MTRYYFAARYSRHAELAGYRDRLVQAVGGEVTSRWIDCHGGQLEVSYTPQELAADPEGCWKLGQADLEDLASNGGGGKGGRHIEHGAAIAYRAGWCQNTDTAAWELTDAGRALLAADEPDGDAT